MYHSIKIGIKNTWDDWHLVSSSRPLVNPPSPNTHFVDIPGGDGVIDLTDSISGRVTYGNRTGSWEFYVVNSGQLEYGVTYDEWYERYSDIMTYLHGRVFDVILEDDPAYYYRGRLEVNSWKSDPGNSIIIIDYNLGPYKWALYSQNDRWLWDPFNFETGVIRTYKDLVVNGSLTITYIASDVSTVPVIFTSGTGMTVSYAGTTYNLNKGYNTMNSMHFVEGENTLVFTGNGRVTIEATGGIL